MGDRTGQGGQPLLEGEGHWSHRAIPLEQICAPSVHSLQLFWIHGGHRQGELLCILCDHNRRSHTAAEVLDPFCLFGDGRLLTLSC